MTAGHRHIVLIGMMGVGKTTVGRLLAERLGWEFWDNDLALEATTGTTAGELQAKHGQAALHATENRLLREALRSRTPTVFAAAGSVVLEPELLAGQLTVWLRASPERERENIAHSGQHHRPLPEDAIAVLQRLSVARLPMYERLADITIEVADKPQKTCARVLEALEARGSQCRGSLGPSPDPHDVDGGRDG